MNKIRLVLIAATLLAAAVVNPVVAAPRNSLNASGPVASSSNFSDLNLPDPHKELRHLSRNLKLKKDQRAGVSFILLERTREINLLIDMESLSQDYRDRLAAKVIEDSDAQIAALLGSKQKRKFDKELTKDHETR
jgi:hypothetical protein